MNLSDHKFYNCKVTFDNNKSYLMDANFLHNEKLDSWEGYNCFAGVDRIYVDADNNVYSGLCENDFLGNIDNWNLFVKPTICKKKNCTGCTDDLIVKKYK